MSFLTIVTTAGQAKLAAAIAGSSTITLSHMAVGDGGGSAVTPSAGMTALVHESYRAAINSIWRDSANAALVYAELVIPSSVGGFTVREAGIFADDGTLVAVANLASTYKPQITEGSASEMVVRMVINLGAAASVNLTISGSVVTATQDWANAAFLKKSENLADVPDKPAALANLGVVLAVMQFMYPVGETLVTSRAGNPAAWLGFGTWERVAAGRVLAGVDTADAAKDSAGKTFGANSVTMTGGNLPAHVHTVAAQAVNTSSDGTHTHGIDPPSTGTSGVGDHVHYVDPPPTGTSTNGEHTHTPASSGSFVASGGNGVQAGSGNGSFFVSSTNSAGAHSHTVDIQGFNSGGAGGHSHTVDIAPFPSASAGGHAHTVNIPGQTTSSAGAGAPIDTTPASYAVHVWKRTA